MIESIATDPAAAGQRARRALLALPRREPATSGYAIVRLYTGTVLTHLTDWYARHGYQTERIEVLSDRSITHMMKQLSA